MADIKLFSLSGVVTELPSTSVTLEKELQTVIERNMFIFFGVTFLKSEFSITNGRIDSLGLDENFCPVIFEYKRSSIKVYFTLIGCSTTKPIINCLLWMFWGMK